MSTARLLRSVRHTPGPQLLHRLGLLLKRKTLVALVSLLPALAQRRAVPRVEARADLPMPLWPRASQASVVQRAEGWDACFLNVRRYFPGQIDWHRKDLNTGTRLWKLNLHYFDWAEGLGDAQFIVLTQHWIDSNRPFAAGYWLDSWNSYAISIRVVAWMGELARRHTGLPEVFIRAMEVSIAEQLHFLANNLELDIGGNHLVKNIKALYWGARYFDGPAARHWAHIANGLLDREMQQQVLRDGFHFELSPAYHCQVFADLLDTWYVMSDGTQKSLLRQRLADMAQVVADMTHPDGRISLFNDGGLNMARVPEQLLDVYTSLIGYGPQVRRYAWLRDAGYHIFRTDELFLIHDAGPVGPDGLPAHAHGDIFAFELSVGGHRVFVDAGVFEYSAGECRARSRSSIMHNTLTLDDQDQCEFWSAFRMGRRARVRVLEASHDDQGIMVDAQHDGYSHMSGQPVHRRRIQVQSDGVLCITDTVIGGQGQVARSRLLLHPAVQIESQGETCLRLRVGDHRVLVETTQGKLVAEPAVWWPDFGVEQATLQLVIDHGVVPGAWSFQIRTQRS
jgi:uncharacterized heparinase superfamily protein